tara:strand:+ start:476 stop:616 length:141 start_codon:yes stop_codon:yes gene_type:complete
MIFFSWHKKIVKKTLSTLKISDYAALWISFVKGLIFGATLIYLLTK